MSKPVTKKQAAPARGTMTVVDTFRGTWVVFDSRNRLFTATLVNVWPEAESPHERRYANFGRRNGWVGSIRAAYTLATKIDNGISTASPVLALANADSEYGAADRFDVVRVQAIEGKVMTMPKGDAPGQEVRNRHRGEPRLVTCDAKTLGRLVARANAAAIAHDKAVAALTAVSGKRILRASDLARPVVAVAKDGAR